MADEERGPSDPDAKSVVTSDHVPAGLFDLPEYDAAFKRFFWRASRALVSAKSPVLGMIRSIPMDQQTATATTLEDGQQLQFEPTAVEATFQLDWRRAVDGDLTTVHEAIDSAAEQEAQQLVPAILGQISKVTEAAGRTMNAEGRPISFELILEMVERIDFDFDENERPMLPTAVVPPKIGEAIAELPPPSAEQMKVWNEMIERKREAFRARQRTRRIS